MASGAVASALNQQAFDLENLEAEAIGVGIGTEGGNALQDELAYQRAQRAAQGDPVSAPQHVLPNTANYFVDDTASAASTYLAASPSNGSTTPNVRLLEELRIARADGTYAKLLNQLAKIELLVLDDFGLEKLTQPDCHDLLEIIEDRHKLKSTIITSQLAIKHWHDYIGEPTTADAILDRLLQHAHKLELKGGSIRIKAEKFDPT